MFDDSIRKLLEFRETIFFKEYNLSDNPVDSLSFANNFLECDNAKRMLFRGKTSNIIHIWTKTVDPVYKYVGKFACWRCYLVYDGNKRCCVEYFFKIKNENFELVSFNGQSLSFRLSIKET